MHGRARACFTLVATLLLAAPVGAQIPSTRDTATGPDTGVELTYAVGADLSFLRWAEEERGVEFRDGGEVRPALDIFRDHGYDWIRLRLFHSPDRLPNDLAYTIASARAAKERGYRFLLDYHFADHWADPQQPYDVIGLSYYPWWHGNLLQLRDNLLSVLERYPDRDVIVVEAGYRPRVYEEEGRRPPFPADAPGGPRKAYLEAVHRTLLGLDSRRIKGIFWWEPAARCGSDFFDQECNARPVITVFDRFKRQ